MRPIAVSAAVDEYALIMLIRSRVYRGEADHIRRWAEGADGELDVKQVAVRVRGARCNVGAAPRSRPASFLALAALSRGGLTQQCWINMTTVTNTTDGWTYWFGPLDENGQRTESEEAAVYGFDGDVL